MRLRYRVLGNQLARSPWQLVGFLFGALYGLGVLFSALAGLVFLGFGDAATAGSVIVGVGSLVTLGWVLGPLIAFGVDTTLDPARLVVFPIPLNRLLIALALAGVCGVPGLVTTVAALGTLATWVHWPAAAVAALLGIPLAVLTAVVASRAVASLASGLGGGRRLREASGVLIFIPLILAGPIVAGVATGFAVNLDTILVVVRILAWTPVGAAWAFPADLATGAWPAAAAKLAIAVATLAIVWMLWRRSLADSLVRPRQTAAARVESGRIGWFGRVPSAPAGAVFARSLTYWVRDPRYLRQLIVVPLLPAVLWFYARDGDVGSALGWAAPLVAFVIGISLYADISYDGTAFAAQLATGVRGWADRVGRTLAAAAIAAPIVLIVAIAPFAIWGGWSRLPGILGISFGVLLASYGVCAVTSASFVIPVPDAGANPFARVPGTTFLQGLAFFGIWLVALVLSSPAIVVGAIAYFTDDAVLSWIALAVGLVVGGAVLVGGILVGGRRLDRTGPALLSRLKAMKSA
nr:hypothetical protein [Microbacterium ulmi]